MATRRLAHSTMAANVSWGCQGGSRTRSSLFQGQLSGTDTECLAGWCWGEDSNLQARWAAALQAVELVVPDLLSPSGCSRWGGPDESRTRRTLLARQHRLHGTCRPMRRRGYPPKLAASPSSAHLPGWRYGGLLRSCLASGSASGGGAAPRYRPGSFWSSARRATSTPERLMMIWFPEVDSNHHRLIQRQESYR